MERHYIDKPFSWNRRLSQPVSQSVFPALKVNSPSRGRPVFLNETESVIIIRKTPGIINIYIYIKTPLPHPPISDLLNRQNKGRGRGGGVCLFIQE